MNLLKREIVQMLFSHLKKKEKKIIIYSLSSEWMLFKVIYPELRKQMLNQNPLANQQRFEKGGFMLVDFCVIVPIIEKDN